MAGVAAASQPQGFIPEGAPVSAFSVGDLGPDADSDSEILSQQLDGSEDMSVHTGDHRALESDFEDEDIEGGADENWDPVFEEIKKKLSQPGGKSQSSFSSDQASEEGSHMRISEHYTNVPYGIQPRDTYEHGKKCTDIMSVCYNGRMRQFVILDSKGITTWKRDAVDVRVSRDLQYPKYEYRLITYLVYARKYNCYFALGKDFSLKVLNRDFFETCSVSADLRSVLFMLFNPVRDELITGGVGGAKVWHFHQSAGKAFTELKPLANYQLTLKYELPNVGGSWVKKVELDYNLEHLYCCSDTDLHVYDLQGKQLFKFERAHTMSITGCRYSIAGKVLVTSSIDTEVKVWSMTGGLVHTFRGHSRAVTNLLIHPFNSTIVITCSLDGSLRMWSLDTMDCIYNLVVSASGLLWMGLTDDNLLYISTARSLTLWHLNLFIHFWSLTRNQVTRLQLEGCPGKTLRVLAVGEDSSIRLFARSNQKNLSTVLPPPSISPLQKILGVCYSREFNVIFVLINPQHIWVYTTRTDPACRIAVWDVHQIQTAYLRSDEAAQDRANSLLPGNKAPSHRATENGIGNELVSNCCCVCILKSSAMLWTDEGCCCPVRHSYLLLGLEDGRVLFMDPVVRGQKYMEFKVSKDPVVELQHDVEHKSLVTVCRMGQMTYIQFWGLPDLELQHEVFCAPDLTAYARIGYTCVTAHESGGVLFHTMELAVDPGLHKAHAVPNVEDIVDPRRRPEHQARVITVDSCVTMKVFCSCSKDGAIKVWEENGALLTEIMLDDTLSAACFLNTSADLIVAFQKHIFFIDHSKVCPHLKAETDEGMFDKESFVYEDPAVMYEGVTANPDPIDLENYLVPYEIEFSKDFLEGKLTLEPVKAETEESETESTISMAPTDVYLSPPPTPGSLSRIDLTLGSEVTKYDLLKQMKSTLETLIDKQKRRQAGQDTKAKVPAPKPDITPQGETEAEAAAEAERQRIEEERRMKMMFEFPRFGLSPGPTPSGTPVSTPEAPSEEEESEEEESEEEDDMRDRLPKKKIPDLELVAPAAKPKKAEKPTETVREELSSPKRSRRAIADVEIDVKGLMKDRRPGVVTRKEADHAHVGTTVARETSMERPHRETVKKKAPLTRKMPKRGVRPNQAEQTDAQILAGGDQMTQVQRLAAKAAAQEQSSQPPSQTLLQEPSTPRTQESTRQDQQETSAVQNQEERPKHGYGSEFKKDLKSSRKFDGGTPIAEESGDETRQQKLAEVPPLPTVLTDSPGVGEVPDLPTLPPESFDRPPSSISMRSRKSSGKRRPMDFLADRASVGMSPTAELESRPGADTPTGSIADTVAMSGFRTPSVMSEVDGNRLPSSLSFTTSKEGDRLGVEEELIQQQMLKMGKAWDHPYRPQQDFQHSTPGVQSPKGQPLRPRWSQSSAGDLDPGRGHLSDLEEDDQHGDHVISPQLPASPVHHSRHPSAGSSHHAVASSAASIDSFGGRESVMSGTALSIPDSISERLGSLDGEFPEGELASISMRGAPGATDEDEHRAWSRIGLPDSKDRPATVGLLPARHAEHEEWQKPRPFTASHTSFQTEELKAVFEAAYRRYQRVYGQLADTERLYTNSGVVFEEKWHERIIERHMLLRMQRLLRAHSAKQRHEAILQQKQSVVHPHPPSAPAGAQEKMPPGKSSRPATAYASMQRVHSAVSAPAPTPAGSRPQTALGDIAPLSEQRKTLQEKRQQLQAQQEKQQLGNELPFRLRMRQTRPSPPKSRQQRQVVIDPWVLDPRNPQGLRPRSSKSIPSKCSRYILLSRPRTVTGLPPPTPLEEELIAERFPEQSERVLQSAGAAIRPTPPHSGFGISYTPFMHSLYG